MLAGCIVLWVTAFAITHIPAKEMPAITISDKTLHFVGYFVLGSLMLLTMAGYGASLLRRTLTVVCTMMAYAAIDEITQPLVNRHCSLGDWGADIVGAVAAVLLIEIIFALSPSRHLQDKTYS